jgi:type VI secretion system secreted protein Hcp
MSSDFFAKVTKIEGESIKEGKEKQIEVMSWEWSLTNASAATAGGGSGKGKAEPGHFMFSHIFDKASPNLIKFGAAGDHIDEFKLTARKSGGKAEDYIVITLTEAFVTSVHIGGGGGGDVTENVGCTFKKIKIEYFEQDGKGGVKAGPLVEWDLGTGLAKN